MEEKHAGDPGCFSHLSTPNAPDEMEANALRDLLTEEQFEALMDLSRRGGPDVEIIGHMRFKSMA